MLYYILLTLVIIPGLIILPTIVKGAKNIPRKGRMILVCNHQSGLDAVLIAMKIVKRRFHYMSKAELFKNKFAGSFYRSMGMYPVNREKNDIQSVKHTLSLLKKEKAICIFPEGHRFKEGEESEAKNGVALFALKTKSPIVPSCFVNKPGFFKITKLVVGKPFNLSEMDEFKDKPATKEVLTKATEIITSKIQELRDNYYAKRNKKSKLS